MAHILTMPRQGNTVESCIIVDWKINEGDKVTSETTVCEVETDKASFEIPAGAAGNVLKILRNAGDDVPVLEPIAVIGAQGEDWQAAFAALTSGEEAKIQKPDIIKTTVSTESSFVHTFRHETSCNRCTATKVPRADSQKNISPRALNLAKKESLPPSVLVNGTGPDGRIIERDVISALEKRPPLSAAAKAMNLQEGFAPVLQGTGLGGRITVTDLEQFSVSGQQLPITDEGAIIETPIKGIRKLISDRMFKSLAQTAQYTLNSSAEVSRLQDFRSRIKTAQHLPDELKSLKITVNDLILFAVSRILGQYPYMNAHKTENTIKTFERVHLGVAVDTPRGLMVPVIRNASLLSLVQISSESKRLAAACQNGSAKPDELSGSTFTVSNLGSFGITGFTPLLNIPEVAVLGVCALEMKPSGDCARETSLHYAGNFVPHIGFSLTIDHQAVDGAPAARFLKALCEAVTNIDLLLAARETSLQNAKHPEVKGRAYV